MTSAPGEPKVSRRLVLGAIPFLGGCSIAQDPAPSTSSSAGTGIAQPHLTPARDPGWVRTENERPGDQAWRLEKVARNAELGAFCDRVSVLPGESVGLRVSSVLGPVTISAHRLGWYAGSRAREVWRSTEPVAAAEQPKPVKDRFDVVGTHWAGPGRSGARRGGRKAATSSRSPQAASPAGRRSPCALPTPGVDSSSSTRSRRGRPTTSGEGTRSTRARTARSEHTRGA